jgi:V/A-type H+-transporting ATPase subunit F
VSGVTVKFFCIGDEDTVRGFRLAGVAGCPVTSPCGAADAFADAIAQPDVAVLMLTPQVAAHIRTQVDTFRLERDRPLLVEIPGPEGPLAGRKSLRQLVQSAVGVSVDRGKEPN